MDVSKLKNVQYEIVWQSDSFVEMEIRSDDFESLRKSVLEIIKLVIELGGKLILTGEGRPTVQYCVDIRFRDDESKKLFLDKLP